MIGFLILLLPFILSAQSEPLAPAAPEILILHKSHPQMKTQLKLNGQAVESEDRIGSSILNPGDNEITLCATAQAPLSLEFAERIEIVLRLKNYLHPQAILRVVNIRGDFENGQTRCESRNFFVAKELYAQLPQKIQNEMPLEVMALAAASGTEAPLAVPVSADPNLALETDSETESQTPPESPVAVQKEPIAELPPSELPVSELPIASSQLPSEPLEQASAPVVAEGEIPPPAETSLEELPLPTQLDQSNQFAESVGEPLPLPSEAGSLPTDESQELASLSDGWQTATPPSLLEQYVDLPTAVFAFLVVMVLAQLLLGQAVNSGVSPVLLMFPVIGAIKLQSVIMQPSWQGLAWYIPGLQHIIWFNLGRQLRSHDSSVSPLVPVLLALTGPIGLILFRDKIASFVTNLAIFDQDNIVDREEVTSAAATNTMFQSPTKTHTELDEEGTRTHMAATQVITKTDQDSDGDSTVATRFIG